MKLFDKENMPEEKSQYYPLWLDILLEIIAVTVKSAVVGFMFVIIMGVVLAAFSSWHPDWTFAVFKQAICTQQ